MTVRNLLPLLVITACAPQKRLEAPAEPSRPEPVRIEESHPMFSEARECYIFNPAVVTVYHPVMSQTDSTPLETADGTWIDLDALARGELRYCAVSRDLLARWGGPLEYGDTITVRGCGDFDGEWVIHDTMNRRYGKTAPRFDRGVAGVVEPHSITPIEVDGRYHIDLLVTEGVLAKFNGEFGIRVQ